LAGYNSFKSFEKYARANGQALKRIRWWYPTRTMLWMKSITPLWCGKS